MKPFDYINSIHKGKDIMSNTDNDELAEEGYNPHLTNRQLSFFEDTIFISNEMNQRWHLDKKLQYDFLINMIRPKWRSSPWFKTEHHDDLEAVVEYFGYSYEKAKQVIDILSSQQIKEIKAKLEKGGLK